MRQREAAPEVLGAGGVERAGLDPLQREVVLPDLQHARRRQRAGLRQPAQAGGLGGVLRGGRIRSGLDERVAAVGERHAPGFVDVPATDAPRVTGPGRQAHRGSAARSGRASRNCASSAAQADWTRSKTSSKPRTPPW